MYYIKTIDLFKATYFSVGISNGMEFTNLSIDRHVCDIPYMENPLYR